jgi:hypothetical protein
VRTQRHAGLSKLLRLLLASTCAATPYAAYAQDLLDSTQGTAPGPAQRSVTDTGEIPVDLEPAPEAQTPGATAPGIKAGGTGLHWDRAPIRYKGEVSLLFTDTLPSGSSATYDTLMYTRIDGTSYVKAPWFAAVEGGLGLSTGLQKSAGSRSDSVTVTGDAGFTLFPVSRFPFHAFAAVTNNKVNQDLVGTSNFTSTTVGANQSYAPLNGRTNYSGGVIYNRLNGDRFGSDTQVAGNASMIAGLDQQQITLEGSAVTDKRKDGSERSNIYNLTAKDEFHDGDALTLISLASTNRTTFHLVGSDSTNSFVQGTSSGSWTPLEDVPLQINGGVHVSKANTEAITGGSAGDATANTDTQAKSDNLGGTIGVNYRWDKNIRLTGTGSLGISRLHNNETRTGPHNRDAESETRTSSLAASASYYSDSVPLGSYYYNYGFSGSATRGTYGRSGSSTQTDLTQDPGTPAPPAYIKTSSSSQPAYLISQFGTAESASHSLSKNSHLDNDALLTVRLTQAASTTQGGGEHTNSLQHSGSINWSQNTETRQFFAGITVSDQRSKLVALDMFNAQLSAMGDVGRYSTLSAAITLQASRQTISGTVSSGAGSDTQTTTTRNAGAEASYVNARAFGVMRLKFSSIFRADTFTRDARFTGTVGAPGEDIRMTWENRFDYTIGLLSLQLLGRLTQASGRTDGLLFASAQRSFGGFY